MRGRQGKGWEAYLKVWHDRYRRAGSAHIVKTEPPVKVLGKPDPKGRFRACWGSSAPVDFVGVAGGRAVFFDAKDTDSPRFALSAVDDHQAACLDAAVAAGGLAFIALRHRPTGMWVLPWSVLGPAWHRWRDSTRGSGRAAPGTASLSAAEIRDIGLPIPSDIKGDGWLPVVLGAL